MSVRPVSRAGPPPRGATHANSTDHRRSSRLGRVLTAALARQGWSVATDARDPAALAGAARGLPGVTPISGDVTDPAHRADLAAAAGGAGRLDLLVNNASSLGPSPLPPLVDYPLDELRLLYETTVSGRRAAGTARPTWPPPGCRTRRVRRWRDAARGDQAARGGRPGPGRSPAARGDSGRTGPRQVQRPAAVPSGRGPARGEHLGHLPGRGRRHRPRRAGRGRALLHPARRRHLAGRTAHRGAGPAAGDRRGPWAGDHAARRGPPHPGRPVSGRLRRADVAGRGPDRARPGDARPNDARPATRDRPVRRGGGAWLSRPARQADPVLLRAAGVAAG